VKDQLSELLFTLQNLNPPVQWQCQKKDTLLELEVCG